MAVLTWDELENRQYEGGVDHGVLYLTSGIAVPWNGLVSVTEKPEQSFTETFFGGIKTAALVNYGEFVGNLKAITYPDEFAALEGYASIKTGITIADQPQGSFHLSYRTAAQDANDQQWNKIHILYNMMATPLDKPFNSQSSTPSLTLFEWEIRSRGSAITNMRPSAHIIIDTRDTDPLLLEELEVMLYGSAEEAPSLPSISSLVSTISSWFRLTITDNGDGTWAASTELDDVIEMLSPDEFQITSPSTTEINSYTYTVSNA